MNAISIECGDYMGPRYNLSSDERNYMEASLVSNVEAHYPNEGVYAALIRSSHEYANLVRSYEADFFPEVAEIPEEEEENILFMALVDTRAESRRVVHATTISGFKTTTELSRIDPESTGFIVIDDLIELDNFTAEEFAQYYQEKDIKVDSCIAVETNFRVGERVAKFNGIDTVSLAYLKTLGILLQNTPQPQCGESGVFASINQASLASFGRVGLKYELLMGRNDLVTPEQELGIDYKPVFIPYDDDSKHLFEAMELQVSEVYF